MRRFCLILMTLSMLLSACGLNGPITAPDTKEGEKPFAADIHVPVRTVDFETFADTSFTGRITFAFGEGGNGYLIDPEKETDPQPSQLETTEQTPETEAPTQPETTEVIPETLPTSSEAETTEVPETTLLEETTEETTPEEETTESPTTPAPTQPAPTQPAPTQPAPTQPAPHQPARQTGKTWNWVDVDLTNQRVTIYSGDTAVAVFPCVTGCIDQEMYTPEGTYHINSKQRNRMLNGRSFVKYWMPFYKDYGLHDAAWREGNFRQDQVWYNGSHGCVNLPEEGAKYIWDHCSVGDTVIVHGFPKEPKTHTTHIPTGDWIVEKKPTCGEAGTEIRNCAYCGKVVERRAIPATGEHKPSEEWTVVKEATCAEEGLKAIICSVCKKNVKEDVIPAIGHSWGEWTVTKEPTTSAEGLKERVCSVCGEKDSEVLKMLETEPETTPAETKPIETTPAECSHQWTEKGRTNTCVQDGVINYECSVCHETKTESIQALGHDYSAAVTKEATCTEAGVRTYTCSRCEDSYTEEIKALGHDYKAEVTKKATCAEAGVTTYTCSRCGDSYTEAIDALGHDYKGAVTKEATCTEAGIRTYTCSRCGDSYTEAIDALGHDYKGAVTKEATCTETGVRTYTCSRCGDSYTEVIPATGHAWGEWIESGDALVRTCSHCGAQETTKPNGTQSQPSSTSGETTQASSAEQNP